MLSGIIFFVLGGLIFFVFNYERELRGAKELVGTLREENKHLKQQLGLSPHRRDSSGDNDGE